jgi:hypothetical protein
MSKGAFGAMKGGSNKGATKSAGSSGGKKGLVTSPFQKPIAGRKISGGR